MEDRWFFYNCSRCITIIALMIRVSRDKFGIKYQFPNRTCIDCKKYPCFQGIQNCVCNFAAYGCKYYQGLVIKSK